MQYSPVNNLIMGCTQQTYAWLCMYIYIYNIIHRSQINNKQTYQNLWYSGYGAIPQQAVSLAFHFSTDRTWGHRWKGDRCGVGLCLRGVRGLGFWLGLPTGWEKPVVIMLVCTPWKKNIKTSSLYLPKTIVHSAKPVFTNGSRYRSTGGPIL